MTILRDIDVLYMCSSVCLSACLVNELSGYSFVYLFELVHYVTYHIGMFSTALYESK